MTKRFDTVTADPQNGRLKADVLGAQPRSHDGAPSEALVDSFFAVSESHDVHLLEVWGRELEVTSAEHGSRRVKGFVVRTRFGALAFPLGGGRFRIQGLDIVVEAFAQDSR